jgi:hypothetical protein
MGLNACGVRCVRKVKRAAGIGFAAYGVTMASRASAVAVICVAAIFINGNRRRRIG